MQEKIIHVLDEGAVIPVKFIGLPDANTKEAANYVDYVNAHKTKNIPLAEVTVKMCKDGKVDVSYLAQGEKFERIRRITGYLSGDLKTWNNAKQAEERERVKHK